MPGQLPQRTAKGESSDSLEAERERLAELASERAAAKARADRLREAQRLATETTKKEREANEEAGKLEARRLAARTKMTSEDRERLNEFRLETRSSAGLLIVCKDMLEIFNGSHTQPRAQVLPHKVAINPYTKRTKQQRIVAITEAWSMFCELAAEA